MNYIILNGKRSSLVKGLLIQSLPAITKPQIRTSIQTIDGRDGDIVTTLGYSAYDRTMKIGLFGDYDIDEIITYFNSSGIVIFSNEPDKFYNYQILKQIDFEKLMRFKTATVTFHVQPFKYSAVDDVITFDRNDFSAYEYSKNVNGVTVTALGKDITVKGRATATTAFYIPIVTCSASVTGRVLEVDVTGTGGGNCSFRLIYNAPTDDDSFGGQAFNLGSDAYFSSYAFYRNPFNYAYIKVQNGANVDITASVSFYALFTPSVVAINNGNVISKPRYTLTRADNQTGGIKIKVNGGTAFEIDMTNDKTVVIDTNEMNAYYNGIYKNRITTGNFEDLWLPPGKNSVSWWIEYDPPQLPPASYKMETVVIENESRWI